MFFCVFVSCSLQGPGQAIAASKMIAKTKSNDPQKTLPDLRR
jgi:hypothetical protein